MHLVVITQGGGSWLFSGIILCKRGGGGRKLLIFFVITKWMPPKASLRTRFGLILPTNSANSKMAICIKKVVVVEIWSIHVP